MSDAPALTGQTPSLARPLAKVFGIADYAFLSDCHSAALVGRDGSVDWLCFPRFDSPAVFARLLDPAGGHWSLTPVGTWQSTRAWAGNSLVVRTTFRTPTGMVLLTDGLAFAPRSRGHAIGRRSPHVLLRRIESLEGTVRMECDFAPRFEYGLTAPTLTVDGRGAIARGGGFALHLLTDLPLLAGDGHVRASFTLSAGESAEFSLTWSSGTDDDLPPVLDAGATLRDTVAAWESWSELHQGYEGLFEAEVRRSALVLKGLTYEPTRSIIAAATTSLPERLGGDANWDYRYVWLRDLTLTMQALRTATCVEEPIEFLSWMVDALGPGGPDAQPVPIVFGVAGERDLGERVLEHMAGFEGSWPVRVGNDAWRQEQLDVLGEVVDSVHHLQDVLGNFDPALQDLVVRLADRAAGSWRQPDSGMWEARDRERRYLSSTVMCWVAVDRAVKMADRLGPHARPGAWAKARDEMRAEVLDAGWNARVGAFTGAFGSDELDASVLVLPLVGFLPATDDRMRSTIDAIEATLGDRLLVRRWGEDSSDFLICTYWLSECLALAGEMRRARAWFDKATACASDLGLLAEEVDPRSGVLLGNVPQAFSHVGLINAADRLSRIARDHSDEELSTQEPQRNPRQKGPRIMDSRLQGRIALVTGSDSGIGQATAIEFAKEGADVVVVYLHDAAGAETTRAGVEKAGGRAIVVQTDVSEENQVAKLFDEALAAFGSVHILVNSAGVDASGKKIWELPTETWDRAIRTNLYGPFFCCRRFVQERRQQGGGGKIINVTSVHEEIPRAGASDYDCAKGGLRNLTRTLALELAEVGINVNNIAPGMVLTPMNQEALDDPKVREEQVQSIPAKRAAEPAEIGRLAVFLASAEANYVSGSSFVIDGALMQNQGQGA